MTGPKVVPPEFEVVPMNNWELKDLKSTFIIPDYERRVDRKHFQGMVTSILNNEFFDIVIRGYKRDDGKIVVIDAQHRIQAFITVYEEHDIQKYNLVLILYPEKLGRLIYRKLNQGKRLSNYDHTLAMDDGNILFFKEMSDYAAHYKTRQHISFVDLLGLYHYCTTKRSTLRIAMLDQVARSIDKDDVKFLRTFMSAMVKNAGAMTGNPLWTSTFLKPLARHAFEKKLSEAKLAKIIKKIQRTDIPEELLTSKSFLAINKAYTWIEKFTRSKSK